MGSEINEDAPIPFERPFASQEAKDHVIKLIEAQLTRTEGYIQDYRDRLARCERSHLADLNRLERAQVTPVAESSSYSAEAMRDLDTMAKGEPPVAN